MKRVLIIAATIVTLGLSVGTALAVPADLVHVPSTLETEPTGTRGDTADDPAIWVNEEDPAASLVITNEKVSKRLTVFNLQGQIVQRISDGVFFGNVDVRDDIVAAAHSGIAIYRVSNGVLVNAKEAAGNARTAGEGLCMWDSGQGLYAINVNGITDRVRVHPLTDADQDGLLQVQPPVKDWIQGSEGESCVVDDSTSTLYLSEEDVGIWTLHLNEPAFVPTRTLLVGVGSNLTPDVEGLAVADGVLYASAQNVYPNNPRANWIAKFDKSTGAYLGSLRVAGGSASDDCDQTDGIDITSTPLPGFETGLLVCQDGYNDAPGSFGTQNFKYAMLP